nr:uncharacterized protein LOC122322078 [Drosophila bipectinata]
MCIDTLSPRPNIEQKQKVDSQSLWYFIRRDHRLRQDHRLVEEHQRQKKQPATPSAASRSDPFTSSSGGTRINKEILKTVRPNIEQKQKVDSQSLWYFIRRDHRLRQDHRLVEEHQRQKKQPATPSAASRSDPFTSSSGGTRINKEILKTVRPNIEQKQKVDSQSLWYFIRRDHRLRQDHRLVEEHQRQKKQPATPSAASRSDPFTSSSGGTRINKEILKTVRPNIEQKQKVDSQSLWYFIRRDHRLRQDHRLVEEHQRQKKQPATPSAASRSDPFTSSSGGTRINKEILKTVRPNIEQKQKVDSQSLWYFIRRDHRLRQDHRLVEEHQRQKKQPATPSAASRSDPFTSSSGGTRINKEILKTVRYGKN